MHKNTMNVRELVNKYQANCDRINAIADACEKEQRERNEAETREYEALIRDNQLLQMRMQAEAAQHFSEGQNNVAEAEKLIRENAANGKQTTIMLSRELVMVADAVKGGIIPVKVQDIIDPLVEGLILHKVGLPMPTGLAGDYIWPTYEAVEATIQGEGVALTDTKIELGKLTASPQRVGIAIPVSRESINQTEGLLETIVKKLMPLSVSLLINKILFSTEKVLNATTLVGPFVGLKKNADAHTFAGPVPTFMELVKMKAEVLASGIDGEHLCFVMTKAMEATLEATPVDAGSGIMVCKDGMIAGVPVFTSHYIGEGYIGLGDWRYQPMGLFGSINFVVDPYSQARKNAVDFVLNADYATTCLQPKGFALKKVGLGA